MARWPEGARERLQLAALALFGERGYDGTTVAAIADRAGVTERTFFRHFHDKREVLFSGPQDFELLFLDAMASADGDAAALVDAAIAGAASLFIDERRPWSRARQAVIDAEPRLQERELLKLAALTTRLAAALADRGVPPFTAAVAAEQGVAAFRVVFATWIAEGEHRTFEQVHAAVRAEARALAAG